MSSSQSPTHIAAVCLCRRSRFRRKRFIYQAPCHVIKAGGTQSESAILVYYPKRALFLNYRDILIAFSAGIIRHLSEKALLTQIVR